MINEIISAEGGDAESSAFTFSNIKHTLKESLAFKTLSYPLRGIRVLINVSASEMNRVEKSIFSVREWK